MRKYIFTLFIAILTYSILYAKPTSQVDTLPVFNQVILPSGKLKQAGFDKGRLSLRYENMKATLEYINSGNLHVIIDYTKKTPKRHSYAVVKKDILQDTVFVTNGTSLEFHREGFTCRIPLEQFSLELFVSNISIFQSEVFNLPEQNNGVKTGLTLNIRPQDDYFYGLGEKSSSYKLNNKSYDLSNIDQYPNYSSFPFFLSYNDKGTYGVFVDSPAPGFFSFNKEDKNLAKKYIFTSQEYREDLLYRVAVQDQILDLYIFTGTAQSILQDFTSLTGKPYLPPRWAFGYHQCRYSYMSEKDIWTTIQGFEKNDMPVESIWLDIDYMDAFQSFTYNTTTFPDIKLMSQKLSAKGIRLAAIIDPGIKADRQNQQYRELLQRKLYVAEGRKPYVGKVWPGMSIFPDFTNPRTRVWWGDLYKIQIDNGISGHWIDMNEPSDFTGKRTIPPTTLMDYEGIKSQNIDIHNIYGLTMSMATHEGIKKWNGGERVFLLSRSGYPGIQRYAFLWTGDNRSDWNFLRQDLYRVISLGMSGMPYSGADIGGFGGSPEEELFTRWLQLGTFYPFMRNHSAVGSLYQEPFARSFKNNIAIHRRYLELRYRLLPYIYTLVYKTSQTGLPLLKPLIMNYGMMYQGFPDECLLGDDILVAPVLEKGQTELNLVLPGETWKEWWSGKVYQGSARLKVTIQDIPFFVRSGSMIPLYDFTLKNTAGLTNQADITFLVYADKNGFARGELYEDDGISYNFEKGLYCYSIVTWQEKKKDLNILIQSQGSYKPERKLIFKLEKKYNNITVNGNTVTASDGLVIYR